MAAEVFRAAVGVHNKSYHNEKVTDSQGKHVLKDSKEQYKNISEDEKPYGYISHKLDKGERTLEFFRRGDCGRAIGPLGQHVCNIFLSNFNLNYFFLLHLFI